MISPTLTIRLNALQIRASDEIARDREALKRTLEVALTFHSNAVNELVATEMEFWNDLAEVYGLDTQRNLYTITKVDGAISIVLADNKDAA